MSAPQSPFPGAKLPRVGRSGQRGDEPIADVHAPRPIETLDHLGARLRVAAASGPGQELEAHLLDADRVVGGDLAGVVEGAEPIEIPAPRDRPVRGGGDGRRHRELGAERGEKRRREKHVAFGQRRDAPEPELRHEPILEGVPQALDSPLRLGACGNQVGDREGHERLPDLGRGLVALELFGQRPVGIRVDGCGEPHGLAEGAQQGEVAGSILLGAEGGREDRPRCIVDGPQEAAGRLARPEPRVGAPVELQEQPGLRPARPAAPVLGRPTAARGADPHGPEKPPHRRPADR